MALSTRTILAISIISIIFTTFILNIGAVTSSEEERCAECTLKVNGSIAKLGEHLSTEKQEMDCGSPCTPCTMTGLSTLRLKNDVCPQKVMEGDDVCYDHPLDLYLTKVELGCKCTLPFNPEEMLKMLAAQQSGDGFGDKGCIKDGKPPIDPQILLGEGTKIDPVSLLKLTECRPQLPKLQLGKTPPTEVSGAVKTIIQNFQLSTYLRACYNKEEVRTVKVTRDAAVETNIKVECIITEDEAFKVPCDCLSKTQFFSQLLVSLTSGTIPCSGNKIDKEIDFSKQVVCLDCIHDD